MCVHCYKMYNIFLLCQIGQFFEHGDNRNQDLIINSLEKPIFKQKVRLRSYQVPNVDDIVFLELKGKYEGVVFKRRVELSLRDFYQYLEDGMIPNTKHPQIMKEIDYIIKRYDLKPKIFLAYDRFSYYDKENKNFRITFDHNLRSREDELKLELGDRGVKYSDEEFYIMELKSLDSIPLWFTHLLASLKIYPKSFSKYGNIYQKNKGGVSYVS